MTITNQQLIHFEYPKLSDYHRFNLIQKIGLDREVGPSVLVHLVRRVEETFRVLVSGLTIVQSTLHQRCYLADAPQRGSRLPHRFGQLMYRAGQNSDVLNGLKFSSGSFQ